MKKLYRIFILLLVAIPCSWAEVKSPVRVLFVVSSHGQLADSNIKTGVWYSELAEPYMEFAKQGYQIDIASPNGGRPPVDPRSLSATQLQQPLVHDFESSGIAQKQFANTLKLSQIQINHYNVIYLVGGHGAVWDFYNNQLLGKMLFTAWQNGDTIAAVCHGVSGLLSIYPATGNNLLKGIQMTGFSNQEESVLKIDKVLPYSLENKLQLSGAKYLAVKPGNALVVVDGQFITGQNPASADAVANAVILKLQNSHQN